MAVTPQGASPGLLDSLAHLFASLLAATQTRVELMSVELEQGRESLIWLIVLVLATLLALGLGLTLGSLAVLLAFWDSHRLVALGGLSAFYLVLGGGLGWFTLQRARRTPRLLASTLAELSKDRQQLTAPP